MRTMGALLIASVLWATPAVPASTVTSVSANSVYQAAIQFTDDRQARFDWSEKRGQPQLVSMFYTSCAFACPMLIDGTKAILQGLTASERRQLGIMLITLDPKRDTPKVLARTRKERSIEDANWALARPEPRDVRRVAGLLGVRYRELADGDFNHTTVVVLLDATGRIVARTEQLGGKPDPEFLAAVRRTLAPQ